MSARRSFFKTLWHGSLWGLPSAWSRAQTPTLPAWQSVATPLWSGDHPRVVAADAQRVYGVVAPFLRGVQDGSSGVLAWHRQAQKQTQKQTQKQDQGQAQEAQWLVRSTPTLLPNHLGPVLDDGAALYWLHGLNLMRTDKTSAQTVLWDARGSLTMTLSPEKDVLYSFNHDNQRQLLAFQLGAAHTATAPSAQVLTQWALPASSIAADAHGVWHLATPASLAAAARASSASAPLAALSVFDLRTRRIRSIVPAPPHAGQQIRAFVPYSTRTDGARFSGVFSGIYWVERDTQDIKSGKGSRVRVQHLQLSSGEVTTPALNDLNEQYPLQADAHALYYFAESGSVWNSTWTLKRWPHGGREAQTLAQGPTPPTSLLLSPDGGELYWTDLRTLYTRPR